MTATLDDALQLASQLKEELLAIDLKGLDESQHLPVADAIDLTVAVKSRIEHAIAIDDELHPEDR